MSMSLMVGSFIYTSFQYSTRRQTFCSTNVVRINATDRLKNKSQDCVIECHLFHHVGDSHCLLFFVSVARIASLGMNDLGHYLALPLILFAFGLNTLLESNKDYYDLSFIMIVFFMC